METTVKIKMGFSNKYQSGYPLLMKEAIANPQVLTEEGQCLNVVDEKGTYIGKGYYGRQNKGVGWILTNSQNDTIGQQLFDRKIIKAAGQRRSFFEDPHTTAFRLFNGEGDGIGGLTIDYFDGYYLINWYSEGIYRFKSEVVDALLKHTDCRGIYEKKRFATDGKYVEDDDFVTGERGEFPLVVQENGVNVAVYLNEGAMVGVFMDQRDVRKAIQDRYAEGRTVLNTFSYTGAFSVFASLGGAQKTTSVDLANRSLPKTIEQFSLNGLDYEAHDIIVEDVFKYFKRAERRGDRFGMVILDPPSFARSKKFTFSAAKDYVNLLQEAIAITEENGVIVASTNHAGVSPKKFRSFVDKAFKEMGEKYKITGTFSLPEDYRVHPAYPEGNYLKVLFIERVKK
ncbi:class I SAM-dependent rRNA methyltransferase [Salipaludibacillus aurantiacus]|uniref:23S rRNA (Cytosine1962-C5)-methyltransferase n=1 Tax=Salipaludibacillus aurantiacus TaxID=1601833 RepID=A0A1H9X1K9_9BACI|nr:class I SAM-dependent rRNA methyltransferase [Salipaludibacillus aurantiacus]SES40082.1 23S rRNA (cytosine1962-C5)-methyltransferase [Salipaludibacillus aurantiacus]